MQPLLTDDVLAIVQGQRAISSAGLEEGRGIEQGLWSLIRSLGKPPPSGVAKSERCLVTKGGWASAGAQTANSMTRAAKNRFARLERVSMVRQVCAWGIPNLLTVHEIRKST